MLGLIAKQNIELISPTIELFLQLLEGKDADKKTRVLKDWEKLPDNVLVGAIQELKN